MPYVIDNKLYSPAEYLLSATGYKFKNNTKLSDVEFIHQVLEVRGIESDNSPVWDYPVNEIDHIIENDLQVVLVECQHKEGFKKKKELRWFEVPEGFYFY